MHWRDLLIKDVDPFAADQSFLRQNIIEPYEFQIDLSNRPVTVDISTRRAPAAKALAVAIFVIAALGFQVIQAGGSDIYYLLTALIVIPGLLFFAVRPTLSVFLMRRKASFSPLDVHVMEPDGQDWRCGYRHFLGVGSRQVKREMKFGTLVYQVVELIHPDKTRNITLSAALSDMPQTGMRDRYAKMLDVPIIEDAS